MDEFAEACELLQKHLPEHNTKEQLMDMCKLMDINKDGLVDLNEFLETFRLCEQAKSNCGIVVDLYNVNSVANNATKSIKGSSGVGVANVNLNGSSPNLPNGSNKQMAELSELRKQSTDEDEDEEILDCCEDSPTKKSNDIPSNVQRNA